MSGERFRFYTRATRNFFELSNYILLAFNLGMFPSLQLFIDLKPDQFVVQYSEIKTVFNFTSLISNKWFVQDVIGTSSAHGVGLFQYCSIPEKGMGKMDTCYRLGLNLSVSYGFEVKFSSLSGPIVFYGIGSYESSRSLIFRSILWPYY